MIPAVLLASYDPDKVKPGWIALVIVVVLGVVTVLLWRSMNTQLRRIQMPPKPPKPPLPQATGLPDRPTSRSDAAGADQATRADPTGSTADDE